MQTVMDTAKEMIYGPRAVAYGHPALNIVRISQQWSLYMYQKHGVDINLTAEDVCWMMALLKMARQMNAHTEDNLVDAIGYIGLIDRIGEPEDVPA